MISIISERQDEGSAITTLTVDTAVESIMVGSLDHIMDLNLFLFSAKVMDDKDL
jgi:hypothetical protein